MTAEPAPDLSIVIVSWNVRELLRACLRSILQNAGTLERWNVETCVVDNASSDGSAAMVAAEFPAVRLIANRENRGFTGGNNQGLAVAQGRYVFFLNPDTVVVDGALATLLAYMDAHAAVGACGPRLCYGDGSLQSSRRRFPTFMTAVFESTPLAWHWPAMGLVVALGALAYIGLTLALSLRFVAPAARLAMNTDTDRF